MKQIFHHATTWLHTWMGLVLGFVLMGAFFFGALSVFDREIDRWAIPQTRFEPQPMPSFEAVLQPVYAQLTLDPDDMIATQKRVIGPLPRPDTKPMSRSGLTPRTATRCWPSAWALGCRIQRIRTTTTTSMAT
ncbi:MAG: PepSY-associated TM helix domain-containing protein [Thiotrichales bacterium]